MAFFGFGPFATEIGSLIGKRTKRLLVFTLFFKSKQQITLLLLAILPYTFKSVTPLILLKMGKRSVTILLFSFFTLSPKDAVAAIRKRFTGSAKNFHIINLTLTVRLTKTTPRLLPLSPSLQILETCVKNCGHRFHIRIANKDFLKDLTNVIQPKASHLKTTRQYTLCNTHYCVYDSY